MRLLFAITVGCFCAVLWVFIAAARAIRRARARAAKGPEPRFTLHAPEFFEAGEFRTPRPLRLEQEIFKQKPRRPLSEFTFPGEQQTPQNSANKGSANQTAPPTKSLLRPEPVPVRPNPSFATLFGETIRIDRNNPLSAPSSPVASTLRTPAAPAPATGGFTNQRFPPASERSSGLGGGIGLASRNKALGDAYNHSLRGSGTEGPVPAIRINRHPD